MQLDQTTKHRLLAIVSTRAAAMGIAFLLAACGCAMIFAGIRDQGAIDIKTPFITGQAKSGFVGVLLVFASVVITVVLAASGRKPLKNQKIKVRSGGMQIEWEGELRRWDEAQHVAELLKAARLSVMNLDQQSKPEGDKLDETAVPSPDPE
jgi:hypothetical protein